jgi:hypothetical protein
MQKNRWRILFAFVLAWVLGVACLFIVLQFSPPRWSLPAMRGALVEALKSSVVYVLPPLFFLLAGVLVHAVVTARAACVAAIAWVAVTVAWWASAFSPVPWLGALRNVVLLLPGSLVPALAFYFLLRPRQPD